MRSSNPVFSDKIFMAEYSASRESAKVMTVEGTIHKTGFLLCLLLCGGFYSWKQIANGSHGEFLPVIYIAGMVGFVFALIGIFARRTLFITAPIYAVCEGVFLGGITALFEMQWNGIALQAVGLTVGTLFGMLFLYRTGIIKVTERFRAMVFTATAGILAVYLTTLVLSFFGISVPYIHDMSGGWIGIGISLFVVGIAALNLVLDFDFINRGSEHGLPKRMEWYGAFGLLVTLVWLYIEILHLLARLRNR